jgi:hypothetical protein
MTPDALLTYWQSTDVQRTWRRYGWTPPSEDPETVARWAYFRNLDTEDAATKGAAAAGAGFH